MGIGANQGYMGMGGWQNPNGGMYNLLGIGRRVNPTPAPEPSMVDVMLARANNAYNNVNPATFQTLFPNLSSPMQTALLNYTAPQSSYGAGRFIGNTQAPAFNFNAPTA